MTEHRPPVQAQGLPKLLEVGDGLRERERSVDAGRAAAAALVEPHHQVRVVEQGSEVSQVVPQARTAVAADDGRSPAACRCPQLGAVGQLNELLALQPHDAMMSPG